MAPKILNLGEWRAHLLSRLKRQVAATHDPQLATLLDELRSYPGDEVELHAPSEIIVPLRIEHDDGELRFMSFVSTFGTPLDASLQDLSVEAFLPADEATSALRLSRWRSRSSSRSAQ